MKINLKYGREGLDFELSEKADIFRTLQMPAIEDPASRTAQCLADPIGAPALREMAAGKRNACIVVSDITRPVPNKILVPPVIEALRSAGMPPESIFFLVATGIHREPTNEELVEILGEEILADHRVISHNAREESSLVRIGHTSSGTPIDINRAYLDSDLKIVVGLVEPHFMAGFSGGRKSVAIGLTSVESVKHLHGTGFLEHPGSRNCELEGNPLHVELTEIAKAAGIDFCLSAVINAERRIGGIFCGDFEESHRAAAEFAGRFCRNHADYSYDIVITTAAGYPLDATYYQAVKGLVGVLDILSPGGGIILASKCSKGLGSDEFRQMLECLRDFGDYEGFIRHISEPANFVIDQWEVEMLVQVLRCARIYLYSPGIPDADWSLTFAERANSVEEGLSLAVSRSRGSRSRGKPRIAVVPEGPYVIPTSGDRGS